MRACLALLSSQPVLTHFTSELVSLELNSELVVWLNSPTSQPKISKVGLLPGYEHKVTQLRSSLAIEPINEVINHPASCVHLVPPILEVGKMRPKEEKSLPKVILNLFHEHDWVLLKGQNWVSPRGPMGPHM